MRHNNKKGDYNEKEEDQKEDSWTKTRLEKICDSIDTVSKEKIVDNYWEYIPEGNYSLNEKIMFIICSISNGAAFPNELLVLQLKQGPCFVNKKDYIFAKPNIAKTVYEKVGITYDRLL